VRASYIITSGQKFNIILRLIDENGSIYKDDSTSTAEISFHQSVPIYANIEGTTAVAKDGVFSFNDITITLKPGTMAHM
jgi:hypothetical protein